jgi:hypothetical protein
MSQLIGMLLSAETNTCTVYVHVLDLTRTHFQQKGQKAMIQFTFKHLKGACANIYKHNIIMLMWTWNEYVLFF